VGISEPRKNPAAVIDAADGEVVAILVHTRASAYREDAAVYRTARTPLR